MKKFKRIFNGGGVLVLSAILALSLTFASCANNSDSDDDNKIESPSENPKDPPTKDPSTENPSLENPSLENPSPALPENVGKNPIKETIKLKDDRRSYYSLELKTDGKAIYIDEDDKYTEAEFAYTYNVEKSEIYMVLKKTVLELDFEGNKRQLMTYDDIYSKIEKVLTVEKIRQSYKVDYSEDKDESWFKEEYPDCDTYEKYETAKLEKNGYESLDAMVKYEKQNLVCYYKGAFGAQITYSYKIDDKDKMTLTEKFTGVKNLYNSKCKFDDSSNDSAGSISNFSASIRVCENGIRYKYYGYLDTEKKAIDFEKGKSSDPDKDYETIGNATATYTEDIAKGTVTIKCEGKEYICEFEEEKFIQE